MPITAGNFKKEIGIRLATRRGSNRQSAMKPTLLLRRPPPSRRDTLRDRPAYRLPRTSVLVKGKSAAVASSPPHGPSGHGAVISLPCTGSSGFGLRGTTLPAWRSRAGQSRTRCHHSRRILYLPEAQTAGQKYQGHDRRRPRRNHHQPRHTRLGNRHERRAYGAPGQTARMRKPATWGGRGTESDGRSRLTKLFKGFIKTP